MATTPFDEPAVAEAMRAYVLETAPVLALRLDADLRVVDANALARQVLPPDIGGRPLADLLVEFTRPKDLAALIGQEGVVHQLTFSTAARMPETLAIRFFGLPEGTLALGSLDFPEQVQLRAEVLGLNRELSNLTRQLHQANAELRELNDLKNRFIGMAAHDLRKPVGVVMAYNEFVLDEAGERLGEEQRGFLRAGLAAAATMKRLIDNFLDVAIIESGQLRLEPSRTDVTAILAGVLPLVRLLAARKRVDLLTETGTDERPVSVDVAKLQQVLVNLVGNAIEHSEAGQRVWLAARRDETALVCSVRDEGQGISPEDQQRLFAPFGRAGTRKTAGERSVGLGLAIARLIVEAHGGRLWVESVAGTGATFLFSVPVHGRPLSPEQTST